MTNRQVQEYLQTLENALKALPADKAAELREQITAHLDEAIEPGMDEEAVWMVLRDLGRPSELVAEMRAELPPAPTTPSVAPVQRRRWRLKATISAAVIAVLAIGFAVGDHLYSEWSGRNAASLTNDTFAWVSPLDQAAVVLSEADGHAQATIPMRPNSVQGFYFDLANDSDHTQTVLALAQPFFGDGSYQLAYSSDLTARDGTSLQGVTLPGPVAIPPGHHRTVRLTWQTSTLPCHGPGTGSVQDVVKLRVHVGWYDRTETIPLIYAIGIKGPGGHC